MKTQHLFWILLLSTALSLPLPAQRPADLLSPEVRADQTVTFRLWAPKAVQVSVLGPWGNLEMKEGPGGVWEATTAPLASDLYTYRFSIDGQTGLDPLNAFTRRDVGTVFSLFYVSGGAGDLYQVQDVPHGIVLTPWYHSDSTGEDRRLNIYLPAAYDGKEKFPVLYLLHGSGNDENGWLELGAAARILDNLIARGKAVPMILVMPNGNIGVQAAPGETRDNLSFRPVPSDRIPNPYGRLSFEDTFPEIVRYVDTHFKTLPRKQSRAVAGLSMGGGQTFRLGLNYPDLFDYYGLFSAGFRRLDRRDEERAFQEFDEGLLRQKKAGCRLYWIEIGKEDFLYERNIKLMRSMDWLGFPYEYTETEGGHSWSNWRRYLTEFSQRLFR